MSQRPGREVDALDRSTILRALEEWAESGDFVALRTRALVLCAWGGAMFLSEALALTVEQLWQNPAKPSLGKLRETIYLSAQQTNAPGAVVLTAQAREALESYLKALVALEWLQLPGTGLPLFLTEWTGRNSEGSAAHAQLSVRTAEHHWLLFQRSAKLASPYRFSDLRFDALVRVARVAGQNPFAVAQFARMKDVRAVTKYLSASPVGLARVAEQASASAATRRR